MSDYNFSLAPLIWFGAIIVLGIWGGWELVDYYFIDDAIRTTEPIKPEIQLIIKDNIVDSIYVYRKP